jgi:hypothetical protein
MNNKQEYINDNRINWYNLSANTIPILEMNQYKIYWNYLSRNPNAIHLLEQNQDKLLGDNLSSNPNVIIHDIT